MIVGGDKIDFCLKQNTGRRALNWRVKLWRPELFCLCWTKAHLVLRDFSLTQFLGRAQMSAAYWAGHFLEKIGPDILTRSTLSSPLDLTSTTPPALPPSRDLPAAAADGFRRAEETCHQPLRPLLPPPPPLHLAPHPAPPRPLREPLLLGRLAFTSITTRKAVPLLPCSAVEIPSPYQPPHPLRAPSRGPP